jgi:hypothetical protein
MSDRSAEASPSTSGGGQATVAAPAELPGRARWVPLLILLDYVAAFLTFAAAGAYLILKVLDDNHSLLYRVIEETARWFYYLDLHEMPGLPDYPSLRNFADPTFSLAYMIAMTAIHLLVAAGLPALARGLNNFQSWARRMHIDMASLSILILGGYACFYARSTAPGIGLAVMAAAALVPATVLAILLWPGVRSLFTDGPRLDGAITNRPHARRTHLPYLLLGAILALYVLGVLLTVFVISVPVALDLKTILAPPN